MNDYTWPSVYFSYFLFALLMGLAAYFFVRSWKHGYWGRGGEDIKYTVFDEEGPPPETKAVSEPRR